MASVQKVTALLDWDTTRRLDPKRENSIRGIERTFDRLQTAISNSVSKRDRKGGFRVYWRVYHGWHQGKTKTRDCLQFEEYVRTATPRRIANVSFSTDYELSGTLLCNSARSPIYDTCRTDRITGQTTQKMVDTLLVCDLLQLARSRESSVLIVVANDDDLIPAVFTAEAWHGQTTLLHSREHTNPLLNLRGIAERMNFE